jgi:hypothetical protein
VDGEVPWTEEELSVERLPDTFAIHFYDCPQHVIAAHCRCVDGVWTETVITEVTRRPAPARG